MREKGEGSRWSVDEREDDNMIMAFLFVCWMRDS